MDACSPLHSQDLADVIGLIRHHELDASMAWLADVPQRPLFRKLLKAVVAERQQFADEKPRKLDEQLRAQAVAKGI
jgi:hypothetical protein